uniref:DNA polymerase nu n=1 Tax=Centroberyx gerrardi TaxID=166262 RepID=UPI003AAD1DF5
MERCSSRLYSGPLSQSALKVLAVLRAQSRHTARNHYSNSSNYRHSESGHRHGVERYYGSQREHQVSSSSSSSSSSSNQRRSSQIPAYYQYSQTPDYSQASQASSSSYWDSSFQRQSSQTPAHYQYSQTYSQREHSQLPAYQSSQALPFTQSEVSHSSAFPQEPASSTTRDRYTLSLQTPQTLAQHQATPWTNSTKEIRATFIINLSPEDPDPDEAFFPKTERPDTHREEPALACDPVPSCMKISQATDDHTSGAQKKTWPDMKGTEGWNIPKIELEDTVAPDSQPKGQLLLSNPTEVASAGGEDGGLYQSSEFGTVKTGMLLLPSRGQITRQEPGSDRQAPEPMRGLGGEEGVGQMGDLEKVMGAKDTKLGQKGKNDFGFRVHASEREGLEHQLGSEDKEITEGYHNEKEKMPISVEGRDHGVTRCRAENPQNMGETETEPGEKYQSQGPKVKPVLGDTTAGDQERTIEERIDVMEGGLEVQRERRMEGKVEAGEETSTEEEMEEGRLCCSGVQLRDGQGETEDCGEGNELPGRNIVPEERRKDRDESLMTDVDRKYGSTSTGLAYRKPSHTDIVPGGGNKRKRAKRGPDSAPNEPKTALEGANSAEPQNQSKAACLTVAMTSDPRVKDAGKLNPEERMRVLEEAGQARALVLTMVYRDGTTQLDPEQKLPPAVCGLLVLMKRDLDRSAPQDSLGPNDSLVYLKLEHTPVWAQQHTQHSQERFTREMLLQVLSRSQLVVCYKAKDLLRTALQLYRQHLNWKQVAGCRVQDPQVSGWLLDPADPASCYQDLLTKHCRKPPTAPGLGTKKVSQVISSLTLLYWLNMELCSKLQSQGLWELYSNMELSMIPVLAAMESHRIHVDKEALKRTSDMLGTKLKQLEQEAHQAAGQIFLVSSSTQLRTVLFEKLRLHERCENKKLPKTINKQQQSTSEAALLQLQDLHPLPKIILEYRQVHKIKSTFVDGILSCMMSKNYISSTWYQTSVVTGRISAKHPNFQALPRQPVQITKKQYIQGKEVEVVTVHPRAMFIPQEGWTFLAADFCQVELRLLSHLSSDPELLRIFTNPQADVFTMLASQWKGVSAGEVTSEEREHAKRIVYSVVYGAGRERLSGILGVSAEQASCFQDSFRQTYREVQAFIHRTIQQCHKQGHVLSIMGRRRTLPNIHSPDWGIRMQAERQAVNFVVQGSAADLCKMAMIRIFSQVSSSSSLSARLIAQLHDELLYEVEDSQVEQFAALVKSTMESLQHIDGLGVHLKVPLKVAVSSGKSWGSMSELNIPPASPSP